MLVALFDVAIGLALIGLILAWDRWKKSATRAEIDAEGRRRSGIDQVICRSCGNRNAEKVKVRTRAGSAVAGGLIFSRKARAQFHCLTCGLYW